VKYIGSSDFKAYGLAPHNVLVESVPLMYNPIREDKIILEEFRRYES
jgi:KUP system potassium uptake protein